MTDTPRTITSSASPEDQPRLQTLAVVAQSALDGGRTLSIRCNCGKKATSPSPGRNNVCECEHCGAIIGLLGVSGGPGHVLMQKPDGTEQGFPVQGFDD